MLLVADFLIKTRIVSKETDVPSQLISNKIQLLTLVTKFLPRSKFLLLCFQQTIPLWMFDKNRMKNVTDKHCQ